MHGGDHARISAAADLTTPISAWSVPHGRLQPCPARETAPTRPLAFSASASSFEPDAREPQVHTPTGSTAWCFWPAWHISARGELIAGRLAPSWSVLPFAALAGRAAEHPVDPTAEAGKVGWVTPGSLET